MTGRELCGVLVLAWACVACGDGATTAVDSDGDGLSDADERALGTNPEQVDSDLDGVPDYSDDTDGDGVSNAEEVAAGTAMPPARASTTAAGGAAGAPAGRDASGGDESGDGAEKPGDDATPDEAPADEAPGDAPAEPPAENQCAELRKLCGAGDSSACEKLDLEGGCMPPPAEQPSCDDLWALCAKNQARACAAFIERCDIPGCGDLEAGCAGGSEPLCTLHERRCGDSSGPGDGQEPAYCPDLRQACENGSEEACALVHSDCALEVDCDALEVQCKEAGGVGEACEQLAAHCG